jgi:endonuclease YncB( thermonuclease family)
LPSDRAGAGRHRVQDAAPEPDVYLLAFKDHSVYGAVAYWVDGDTLHYFMPGNQHNQASVSLVDREMTARLNKASGMEVKLPAEK